MIERNMRFFPDPRPSGVTTRRLAVGLIAAIGTTVVVGTGCLDSGASHVFVETKSDCVVCHKSEYVAASDPVHLDVLPMECGLCHSENAWQPSEGFAHDKGFPLSGGHADLACKQCHTNGYGKGDTSSKCVSCHEDDYDRSPFPGHQNFATTCDDCHSTKAWKPASSGHPENRFPITRGPHKIYKCNECHNADLGPDGKDNADCVGCHTGQHSRKRADAQHREVGKYPSGDAAPNFCLSCHPTGGGADD